MENSQNQEQSLLSGKELDDYLFKVFNHDPVITTTQFKRFLKISSAVFKEMRELNTLPRMIPLTQGKSEGRFLVVDVARWIEERGGLGDCLLNSARCGRGRSSKQSMFNSAAEDLA